MTWLDELISFRGPVISHRTAGRNLIDGLHREGVNLIKAQLPGFVLVHARPLPRWLCAATVQHPRAVPAHSGGTRQGDRLRFEQRAQALAKRPGSSVLAERT